MRTPKLQAVGFCLLIILIVLIQGCSKQNQSPGTQAVASLNVINALPTSVALIPVSGTTGPVILYNVPNSPQYGSSNGFGTVGSISYGAAALLTKVAGNIEFYLVQRNADTTLDSHGSISKTMFNSVLNFSGNSSYSLFITGKDTTAPDYLLVQDVLPYHSATDSTAGIRFVNLSANSNPVSINIKNNANGSEVSGLAFKGVTNFKNYAATASVSSYIFEFRDAGSGILLASYTLNGVNNASSYSANTVRFKNLTIALIGQPGGTGGLVQKCILINNY